MGPIGMYSKNPTHGLTDRQKVEVEAFESEERAGMLLKSAIIQNAQKPVRGLKKGQICPILNPFKGTVSREKLFS